ncbi:hypothetical protein CONLIGDRAFT_676669 [Coniochaeta ligniaria NRRL 30616]|uniref:DUF2867 domain-containing protein n=1 Tax=Coniochaeta ligniaria NRRL 30616 TaxID=1408157 RepID=A0A1J7JYF1_9PEZI|nr:hypothetical protein CONLIGDRAFT_676669 [Coniochaeta ligniaria NRRL 30616]
MPLAPVRTVPFPSESALSSSYKRAYFIDAFSVTLPAHGSRRQYTPDALAQALFCNPPSWFSLLMWIRDRVMSILGVKTSTEIRAAADKSGVETVAVFPIVSRTETEIVLGEDDSHLDFRTSILIRENQLGATSDKDGYGRGEEIVATTVVHCHGLLGRAYITIIKPFHVLIVKYSLARVPDRIAANDCYSQKCR